MEVNVSGKVNESLEGNKGRIMPNWDAVNMTKDLIKNELGTLEKVPMELADSIIEIYYRTSLKLTEMMEIVNRKSLIPKEVMGRIMKQFGPVFLKFLSQEAQQIGKDLEIVTQKVKALKVGDKSTDFKLQDLNLEFIHKSLIRSNVNTQGKTAIPKEGQV